MKLIHGMGLFALSGLMAACSLTALEDGPLLSIRIEDRSEGTEIAPGEKTARVAPQASGSPVPPPTTISGFDCIGINVLGPGIPDSSRNPEPNLAQIFDQLLKRQSYCSYRGILAGPLSTTATVAQELSMVVPAGNTRMIQLVGLVNRNGSNDCQVEFTPGMNPPLDANGKPLEGDAFELGRAVVDLFQDRLVSIVPVWNGLSAAEQEVRRLDCGDGGSGPNPTPSYGPGSFQSVTPMASPRADPAVLFDERGGTSKIHVAGGAGDMGTHQILNLPALTWSPGTFLGSAGLGGSALVPFSIGTNLKLLGGAGSPNHGQYRDFDGTSWSAAMTIPSSFKVGHSQSLIDAGATYFFGSWDISLSATDTIWKFVHSSGAHTAVGTLPSPKYRVSTARISAGLMIAAGGMDGMSTSMNTCTRVDGGVVSACATLPYTVHEAAFVGIPGGKALLAGGFTSQTTVVHSEAYIYNAGTDNWTQVASMPGPRMGGRAFLVNGGTQVLVLGGQTANSAASATTGTFLYTIATNTWSAGPAMNAARSSFGFTQVPDGRIFIFGGLNTGGAQMSQVEYWAP